MRAGRTVMAMQPRRSGSLTGVKSLMAAMLAISAAGPACKIAFISPVTVVRAWFHQ